MDAALELLVVAATDAAGLDTNDDVVITLKAHSVPPIVEAMQPLLGPETAVVTAVNGLPWWYFHGLDGPHRDHRIESVDPGGRQWDGIGPSRAIGCVVYPAAGFVREARLAGAITLEINRELTEVTGYFDQQRHGDETCRQIPDPLLVHVIAPPEARPPVCCCGCDRDLGVEDGDDAGRCDGEANRSNSKGAT